MKKSKRKSFAALLRENKWQIINGACFVLLAVFALWMAGSFKRADCFTVQRVVIRENDGIADGEKSFAYFKGRNIFSIDLARESARIALSYPSYRKIRLTRFPPDCIFVDFLRRTPVACVHAARPVYVDDGAVMFYLWQDENPPGLPVINGLERRISQVRLGRRSELREVGLSLAVINAARADKTLKDCRIRMIDVSSPDNLVFFLLLPGQQAAAPVNPARPRDLPAGEPGIEVRVGAEGIPQRMQILSTVLTQMRATALNIKYIDLRFKEPVIKFKNMEKFARL